MQPLMAPMLPATTITKINSPQTRPMKQYILTTVTMAFALGATAQNANVVNAFNYMKDGQYAKAVEFIEPATQDAKTGLSEKTWRYRGDIYRSIALGTDEALKGQFPDAVEKAAESYMKANELDAKGSYKRENALALGALQGASLNAGNDAFGKKDYQGAVARYRMSEKIAKSFGQVDTNAIFNRALAYESAGDAANAISSYREAIAAGYNKPEVYRYIASLQRKGDDLNSAIGTAREGLARFPGNKDLMLDEMQFLLAADRSDEAEASVRAALDKDPSNAVLWSVLGGLYDKKAGSAAEAKDLPGVDEWYKKAEGAYLKAIEIDPKLFDAYFNVGVVYNNRAASEYEKCNSIKDDAQYTKCKKVADDIYLKAVPFFEKAHELNPTDLQTIQQLIKLYGKTNDQAKYAAMKEKMAKLQ
jgi:tetratricopeptide (TPR) repeat protein